MIPSRSHARAVVLAVLGQDRRLAPAGSCAGLRPASFGLVDDERRVVGVGRHRRQARRPDRRTGIRSQAGTGTTDAVSRPERSREPGTAPGRRAIAHRLHPIDQDPDDAVGPGEEAGRLSGEVMDQAGRLGGDGLGIEDEQVSGVTLLDQAAVAQAEEGGGLGRHHVHRLLDRNQLAAAQAVVEERGGVVGATHAVEVGPGVGAADHGPRDRSRWRRASTTCSRRRRPCWATAPCGDRRPARCRAACRRERCPAPPRSRPRCGRRSPRWPGRRCRR